ncbi:hypothetical protein [Bacillus mycoides]|uniref:hypothetical protein n=1 Tax=Bacillus mycoides TaxID=1405 RepID=UPI00065BED5A|nr:hypothetical protein [Bacillus mycoides]KMQ15290.1 hypothetical protein TU70_19210 [Bacillus mycoides]
MKITHEIYQNSMERLLELYDEYKEIAPDDLYNQFKNSHYGVFEKDESFIALEHGSLIQKNLKYAPEVEVMYIFNDFEITVNYNKDGSLLIYEILDTTDDGLGVIASVSDESGEVEFKVTIDLMYK